MRYIELKFDTFVNLDLNANSYFILFVCDELENTFNFW